jgi:hypothetical protein
VPVGEPLAVRAGVLEAEPVELRVGEEMVLLPPVVEVESVVEALEVSDAELEALALALALELADDEAAEDEGEAVLPETTKGPMKLEGEPSCLISRA